VRDVADCRNQRRVHEAVRAKPHGKRGRNGAEGAQRAHRQPACRRLSAQTLQEPIHRRRHPLVTASLTLWRQQRNDEAPHLP
jgi:hypothetical protein